MNSIRQMYIFVLAFFFSYSLCSFASELDKKLTKRLDSLKYEVRVYIDNSMLITRKAWGNVAVLNFSNFVPHELSMVNEEFLAVGNKKGCLFHISCSDGMVVCQEKLVPCFPVAGSIIKGAVLKRLYYQETRGKVFRDDARIMGTFLLVGGVEYTGVGSYFSELRKRYSELLVMAKRKHDFILDGLVENDWPPPYEGDWSSPYGDDWYTND